jgi:class 3 adenylate cyclase
LECPRCGTANADDARFCQRCGRELTSRPTGREERKLVSALFVDIVGSTARADGRDPEEFRDGLERYYTAVKREIERFGGAVEKFIGDAVVAIFGAPVAHGDDAERAVRAGLGVLQAMRDLNEQHPSLGIEVRAAVNTGEAIVSVDARPDLGDAFAFGDAINTASRLQDAAPAGRLIVGAHTYRATRRAIAYEALPPIEARGKRPNPSRPGWPSRPLTGPVPGSRRRSRSSVETANWNTSSGSGIGWWRTGARKSSRSSAIRAWGSPGSRRS